MAWYRNKETNIAWEILGDFENQISSNPIFEKVKEPIKELVEEEQKKTVKQSKK